MYVLMAVCMFFPITSCIDLFFSRLFGCVSSTYLEFARSLCLGFLKSIFRFEWAPMFRIGFLHRFGNQVLGRHS
jgi:hypothetical protein